MSVMFADAKTRGVENSAHPDYCALPCTPHQHLEHCYVHVAEYTEKVKADLKAAGCWLADPRKSTSGGITDIAAPSLGVEESNMEKVQTSWHRWNANDAPMPDGTTAKWRDLLGTGHFILTSDKNILWDAEAWVWESPTWFISSVSVPQTGMALLVNKQYYYKSNSTRVIMTASTCISSPLLLSSYTHANPRTCSTCSTPPLHPIATTTTATTTTTTIASI